MRRPGDFVDQQKLGVEVKVELLRLVALQNAGVEEAFGLGGDDPLRQHALFNLVELTAEILIDLRKLDLSHQNEVGHGDDQEPVGDPDGVS